MKEGSITCWRAALLIHYYQPALQPLLDELFHYLGESDMNALRDILTEIEQRIKRFRKGADKD